MKRTNGFLSPDDNNVNDCDREIDIDSVDHDEDDHEDDQDLPADRWHILSSVSGKHGQDLL